ncbi:MAG: Fe-S protein assembly co-chaperone HscB [Chitinophagaceae bacterium]|nr:Fe-S protein assembly co-chaperone HscB [Chitinophagaceae bacterium]
MNFFELFGMPLQFLIDKTALKKKYLELSKQSHPDYFVQQTTQQQETALQTSAELNKAYKTLTNKSEIIAYVLRLKGLLATDEKYELPPEFLLRMMEVNEQLAEANMDDDVNGKAAIYQQLEQMENEIYEPVKEIIENYKDEVTTEEELLQVKDYYFKRKYLQRLRQQLQEKL